MKWPWIAVPVIAASYWLNFAQGQAAQATASQSTNSTDSEISTKTTDEAIKVQVNLVLVPVVVKDSTGKAVLNLKEQDFQVFDNGKLQKISSFHVQSAQKAEPSGVLAAERKAEGAEPREEMLEVQRGPAKTLSMPERFVALVFDDLHLTVAEAMAVHAATEKLFANVTTTDRVAIYSTQGNVEQDFTADAEALRKTLRAIVPHTSKEEGHYECPRIS